MSLENILKKIDDDARKEAEAILALSREKAEQINKEAAEKGEALAQSLLTESRRQAELEASRIVTQARLEKKIDVLSCKKELIDSVFEQAFAKSIGSRPDIKRIVVDKEGEKEEIFDEAELKEELRPRLEKFIADALEL